MTSTFAHTTYKRAKGVLDCSLSLFWICHFASGDFYITLSHFHDSIMIEQMHLSVMCTLNFLNYFATLLLNLEGTTQMMTSFSCPSNFTVSGLIVGCKYWWNHWLNILWPSDDVNDKWNIIRIAGTTTKMAGEWKKKAGHQVSSLTFIEDQGWCIDDNPCVEQLRRGKHKLSHTIVW